MKPSLSLTVVLSCSLLSALSAREVAADELAAGLRAGANYSDNVQRVPVGETESAAAVLGADLRALRENGRLLYDVFGNLDYFDYFDSDLDSELFGQVSAQAMYAFVPERLSWRVSGSLDQTRRDLFRPLAPGNIDEVTVLSTGPTLNLRFGEALEAQLEAHYTAADYSESPLDSDTVGGSLIAGRRLSPRSFIGLGGSTDRVTFVANIPGAEDFDRREYFLRFQARGSRTDIEIDAGYSQAEGETFDNDGPMARINATRRLTPAISAFARYMRGFPTSAGAAFTPDSPASVGTDPSVLTGAPREAVDAEVGFQLQSGRTDARLSYLQREETALADEGVGRDLDAVTAQFSRMLAPNAQVTLYARLVNEDVAGTGTDEQAFGSRISFRLGRLLSLTLGAEYRDRDSEAELGSYQEMSGGIFLRYGTGNPPAGGM